MNNDFLWKEFYLDKSDPSWVPFFQQEAQKDYFFPLLEKLSQEYQNYKCWPRKENIFRLFREIAVHQIKVIILGQDPYHLPEVADGLAFSTQKPNYIPASLKNIFLEFSRDLNCVSPTKGDLLPWVKEGVFLLNTALTVRNGQALSHMSWWKEFIYSLLIYLKNHDQRLIWIFWGQKAKKIGEECQIDSEYSLASAHPSPYSAEHGFFGSCPFSQVNKLLSELGKSPIDWLSILLPKLKKC
ncbi:MAG: uracil-DNA glycosylase [Mycoplasmataceae bacterium RV_VA103A]|nr:MAG: uracil-DNA glycosylase [Mycoplasmataceae bacterium RV_VA103A]